MKTKPEGSVLRRSKLIIVRGLPGSGKTKRARQLESELGAIRFCPDEWMNALSVNLYDEEMARSRHQKSLGARRQRVGTPSYNVPARQQLFNMEERDGQGILD